MNRLISTTAFCILIAATWLSFSNSWVAADINSWQAKNNGGGYYPALSIFVLSIPPLLLLALVKLRQRKASKKV